MKQLIQKLVETVGPSGYEQAVRELVRGEIEGQADEIRVDAMGNLIARKGTKTDGGLRIMLSAHMDEIGVIATHIDENGFVRFTTIGGVRPHTCIGGRVHFLNGARGLIYMDRPEDPGEGADDRQPVYRSGRHIAGELPGEGRRPGGLRPALPRSGRPAGLEGHG